MASEEKNTRQMHIAMICGYKTKRSDVNYMPTKIDTNMCAHVAMQTTIDCVRNKYRPHKADDVKLFPSNGD